MAVYSSFPMVNLVVSSFSVVGVGVVVVVPARSPRRARPVFSKSISRETVSSAGGGGGGGISSSFSPGGGGGIGGRGWSLIFTLSIFPQHWSLHFLQNVSIFFFLSEYSSLSLAL